MRLAHVLFIVALLAIGMTLAREPIGRVFVVVVCTGVGEIVFGLAAVMALFQTVGAFGEAKTLAAHVEAVAATAVVLAVGTAAMSGLLFAGTALLLAVA